MKKCLFLAVTLFCAGGLIAQDTGPEVISSPQTGQKKQSSVSKQDADTAVSPTAGPMHAAHGKSKRGRIIVAQVPAAAEASKKSQPSPAAKKEMPKAAEQDSEEAGVMIDSKSDDTEGEALSSSYATGTERQEDAAFASSIPASYGQMKGVLNEQGRNVLVFENEEGILSFVQVSLGRDLLTWKLLARVARSQD